MAYYEAWYTGQVSGMYYRHIFKHDGGSNSVIRYAKAHTQGLMLNYAACYTMSTRVYRDISLMCGSIDKLGNTEPFTLDPNARLVRPDKRKITTSAYME